MNTLPISNTPPSSLGSDEDDEQSPAPTPPKRNGRRKIPIEFIEDKSRRHITFSKRKAGIMKKAYELSTLTGTQVLLLVASETGHVYTFATPKLQPLITKPEGKNLIQACLNATDTLTQSSGPSTMLQNDPYGSQDPSMGGQTIQQNDPYSQQGSAPTNMAYHHGIPESSHGGPSTPGGVSDEKDPQLPYLSRSSFNDVKPFHSQQEHHQSQPGMDNNGYSSYPAQQMNPLMMNQGMRMPSYGLPSTLSNLSEQRFSGISNLDHHHSQQLQSGGYPFNNQGGSTGNTGYNPPVINQQQQPGNGSQGQQQPQQSHPTFPSHSFPSNQIFSKASNLPSISRD